MKTMIRSAVLVAVALCAGAPDTALAQFRAGGLAIEARGGAALPSGDFSESFTTGWTLGGNATFMLTPMVGVYAGYTFNEFGIDDDLEIFEDVNYNVQGWDAGARLVLPVSPGMNAYARGGVVYYKGELSGDGGSFGSPSELGFDVGGGLEVPLGPTMSVTPAVSYTSVNLGDGAEDKVSFMKLDVGLRLRL